MKKILFILAAMVLSGIGLHAGNTITYTASEKLPGYRGGLDLGSYTFGSKILTHDFSNGTGMITCDGAITRIGECAFEQSSYLTSVEIPNSVTSIRDFAFSWCTSLPLITIPSSVTTIGDHAFRYCNNLKTMYCYALTPPSLGYNVFENVPQDISIYTFNAEAYQSAWGSQLSPSCFKPITAEVGGIKYEFFDGNKARVIAKDGGYTGNIVIPEQITYQGLTFAVTEIGQRAFRNCTNLTSITIPNSVTTIGEAAFSRCVLTSITIPASVTQIGAWAFEFCSNLQDIDLPSSIRSIDVGTFQWAGLTSIIIPASVERIEDFAFWACPLDYVISMSETPPALGNEATFPDAKKALVYVLTSDAVVAYQNSDWGKYFTNFYSNVTYKITTPTTVEVVHAIPANGAVNLLPVVTLQETNYNVVGIGNEALKGDTSLRSISLPATIQYIGDSAFSGCTKLKQTNSRAWEDLQTIGASAFYGCSALDSIVIPEGVQTIGKSAFMGCSKLTSISLPTGLKNIPDECFKQCPLGQEIIVPEGVETIGKSAFEGTNEAKMNAESLTLPSTLKEINFAAFFFHDGLKGVTCLATTPPTLKDQVFAEYQYQKYKHDSITVYVPNRDVMAAYRDNKNQWGSDLYKFKFSDLMAEANKQYLYTVAGNNDEAKKIAKAYCDSIDRATTTQQVQYYINTALTKIDKYTLNDYKIKLANYLDSVAGENLDAKRIAEEYRKKILLAIFRQEAEKIFAEGLAKINAVFELIDFKKACCDNLRNSAQNLGKEIIEIAEEYCILINQATTKEEANRIYLDGAQEISMYMQLSRYWKEPSEPGECRTTYGYPK